LNLVSRHFRKM